jgi:tripartite-type tricarboxylate transporter receptor subunit TctC
MIGGVVDSNVEALTSAVPNVRAGQYRALAVLSPQRQPLLPDVPTFAELGYPEIVGETWYAVFAPAGTPAPVVERLNGALRKITASPQFVQTMRQIGNQPRSSSPEELREITLRESQRWGDLIQKLKIPPVQ